MFEASNIRPISINDIDRIVELEQKCFNESVAYSKKQLSYLITKANSTCLLDEYDKDIRGFIIVLYRKGTGVAGIETINVDPDHQRKGVGRRLLGAIESYNSIKGINKIRLEVSAGNISAINLYEKSGFRKISLLKNYYINEQHGTFDAFRMVKNIIT